MNPLRSLCVPSASLRLCGKDRSRQAHSTTAETQRTQRLFKQRLTQCGTSNVTAYLEIARSMRYGENGAFSSGVFLTKLGLGLGIRVGVIKLLIHTVNGKGD